MGGTEKCCVGRDMRDGSTERIAVSGLGYSVLDTAAMPEDRRFALYSLGLGISHRTARVADDKRPFAARLEVWMIGDIVMAAGHQMALRISRDDAQIRADGFNHVTLMMMQEGSVRGEADGPVAFGVDEIALFDLTRAMDVTTTDNRTIAIRLPRHLVADTGLSLAALHGFVIGGAPGRLLADHFRALLRYAPTLAAEDAALVAYATVALFAVAVKDQRMVGASGLRQDPITRATGVRDRVERYIDDHLHDLELNVDGICRGAHLSRSTLYRVFGRGGVASAIRQRRLAAVHRALCDPAERRGVAELAFDFGFTDAPHFASLFRRRYGCSPNALRRQRGGGAQSAYHAWLDALSVINRVD